MKRLLLLLITILSLGTRYLNASNLDTLLVKEYEACRAELLHIIDENNLRERLMGYPFYAYMVGQLWMIVVNMGEKTTLFLKEGGSSRLASLSYLCAMEDLKGPFSLFDLDIANNRRLNELEYNPLFRYFVLFSPDGCVQYEWSSSTYFDDNERISHTLGKCASFVLGAFITCPELHEDVWKKEYYKQPFKGEGTGIFIGPYPDKPHGRVFYHIDDDTYEVAAGKWFEEYPHIYDTVLKKFNPSPERTSEKYGVIEQQNEFYPYGESISQYQELCGNLQKKEEMVNQTQ